MRIFEAVGHTGSFTRAAERLHLTQSAVSRQVRHLEEQIGETLLIRHHHRLELTASGALLFQALGRALQEVETAVRTIREKNNLRRLRVNVPPTFGKRWLMPRLAALRAAHPEIDLSISTQLSDSLGESGLLDCAIRFGDGEWPDLQVHHLMTERHIAVCSPALLADVPRGKPVDLTNYTFLHVLAEKDRRYLTWTHWLSAAGLGEVDSSGGLEFDLLDMSVEAACQGLGVAVVDRAMVRYQLEAGLLMPVLDVSVEGHESYWLVTRAEAQSPNVGFFRQWLIREISASEGASAA